MISRSKKMTSDSDVIHSMNVAIEIFDAAVRVQAQPIAPNTIDKM